jgi:hypothetical protein
MADAAELRAKAERALRLAAAVTDDTVADNLRKMAAEFLEQAEQLEQQPKRPRPDTEEGP